MANEGIMPIPKDRSTETRNIVVTLVSIFLLYLISIYFYHKVEGWSPLDATYFVTMTITTIGYGDFAPHSDEGKIFTMFIAFIGIGLAFLLIANIVAFREKALDRHMFDKLMVLKRLSVLHRGPPEKQITKGLGAVPPKIGKRR